MRFLLKISSVVRSQNSILVLLGLAFVLISCDSSDDIPVQQVDSQDRLSDVELQQKQGQKQSQSSNTFYFGFDLRASPQEDAAQYLPFLRYLEKSTGYYFKLRFTAKNSSTAEALGQNTVQFAAMGGTSFLYAQSRYGVVALARGLNSQGKAEYQSVLVVAPESPILTIEDIKGRSFAFGNRSSTQGHLIPRIMLMRNGISLSDLGSYNYTGSHQNCAEAVVAGRSDVCGMQDQLAEKLAAQGVLKIIYRSRYYPSSGIATNNSVPAEVRTRVKQALLDFKPHGKDRQGLYHWDRTEMPNGFVAASESDYTDLRQWALRLGFL